MTGEPSPQHSISTRNPMDRERELMLALVRPSVATWGCLSLVGVVWFFLLGFAGRWVGNMVSADGAEFGRYAGWSIAVVCYASLAISFFRYDRRSRAAASIDLENGTVQEIAIRNPRVVAIASIDNTEPIFCFDIGNGQLLFMQGKWMYDAETYAGQDIAATAQDESVDAFLRRVGFPNSEFTVVRLPHTGEVLSITLTGRHLDPEQTVDVLKPEFSFRPSELFPGRLEELGTSIERAAQMRQPGRE